jgi:hypothetical protein
LEEKIKHLEGQIKDLEHTEQENRRNFAEEMTVFVTLGAILIYSLEGDQNETNSSSSP